MCLDAFCIGKHEVTQSQWKRVMGDNPSGFKQGNDYPVENVSWDDVTMFINKLNSLDSNNRFRLPTEAEWEYACRSGGQLEPYSGSSRIDTVTWYNENSGGITHPVNTKESNKLGLFNFSGNVREWCSDIYAKDSYANHRRNNPINIKGGLEHVVRGGCWYYEAKIARCSNRYSYPTDRQRTDLGFRAIA